MRPSLDSLQWLLLGVAGGLLLAASLSFLLDGVRGYIYLALGGAAAAAGLGTSVWAVSRRHGTEAR